MVQNQRMYARISYCTVYVIFVLGFGVNRGGAKNCPCICRRMEIEWEEKCDDDYVSFHDGNDIKAPLVAGNHYQHHHHHRRRHRQHQ